MQRILRESCSIEGRNLNETKAMSMDSLDKVVVHITNNMDEFDHTIKNVIKYFLAVY